MAKYKLAKPGKKKAGPSQETIGMLPCLFILITGGVILFALFWFALAGS